MKSFVAKKVHMTQVFADNGVVTPVTVLSASAEEAGVFAEGDAVQATGTSKGKGFQGVVKRHGFHGGRRSHGQKHSEREPGSISGGTRNGGRVPAGMRMAGRMGGDKVTVKNLTIVKILPDSNEVMISGAIPGRRGTKILIREK